MARFGYTMMCEQSRPDRLVRDVQAAERAGFDFSVISDHYAPWLDGQGHSGYAWSILGAAAQATDAIPLMTYVTCPILRYHPAVVAQKAATMQILSGGRFRLGLGTPASRRSRWCRSAPTRRRTSARGPNGSCCQRCGSCK